MVRALVMHKAHLESKNAEGWTPLIWRGHLAWHLGGLEESILYRSLYLYNCFFV